MNFGEMTLGSIPFGEVEAATVPLAFFVVPLTHFARGSRGNKNLPGRYVAMDDFTSTINADGGAWQAVECLGDKAVVKVRASFATLTLLNSQLGFTRLPKDRLDDPLSDLTATQKLNLNNFLLNLGYTSQEIQDALGADLGTKTLRDVIRFMLTRRLSPRVLADGDTIVMDGAERACAMTADQLDGTVQ